MYPQNTEVPAGTISAIDEWLDAYVCDLYKHQPMAQDWARISKVIEELGETISEMILFTGQNPRKTRDPNAKDRMLKELADVVCTGTLAIQHFTKDETITLAIIAANWSKIHGRVPASEDSSQI